MTRWTQAAPPKTGRRRGRLFGLGAVIVALWVASLFVDSGTTPDGDNVLRQPHANGVRTPQRQAPASDPRAQGRELALDALATAPVKGRAPMTGYAREQFGQAWLDTNRNGCDTRNDILRRDLTEVVLAEGTNGCVVVRGQLSDPYTGATIQMVRAAGDPVEIDHVVALANAWVTGAQQLDLRQRAAFANDPMNLLAVDGSANSQKSASDAATWLPPNKAFRCAYVARQVAVKRKYRLWVTPPERTAIERILTRCPDQRLPADSGAPVRSPIDPNVPAPRTADGGSTGDGSVHYENCDAARAAGAAPVHRDDPGYDSHLDRDGDGTGCDQ